VRSPCRARASQSATTRPSARVRRRLRASRVKPSKVTTGQRAEPRGDALRRRICRVLRGESFTRADEQGRDTAISRRTVQTRVPGFAGGSRNVETDRPTRSRAPTSATR
jgi:hypothetical protein